MVNRDDYLSVDTVLRQAITPEMAHFFKIIPASLRDNKFEFYISDKEIERIPAIRSELNLLLNKETSFVHVDHSLLIKSLTVHYRVSKELQPLKLEPGDSLDKLIWKARNLASSDIHVEVYSESARIRLRIDGLLVENQFIQLEKYPELINQIKVKANLDITERRLPQDGRIEYRDFDVRVSILPVHHGEKVVMRILGRNADNLDIEKIGLRTIELEKYLEAIKKTSGIILVSGPTGSGKTFPRTGDGQRN